MDQQELLARIAELEEENARLKHTKTKVSIIGEFSDKYPFVRMLGFAQSADAVLSKLIRSVCFPITKKDTKKTWYDGSRSTVKNDYMLQTKDMTEDQKKLFREIADKLLCVLSKYEVLTKQGGTK